MVTNEEIVLNFPEDAIRAIESSGSVEAFDGTIDAQDRWLLRTPFDASLSGIAPGMIARIARSGFSQGPVYTYVIETVTPSGFVLKLPGSSTHIGRGPGSIFGIDPVKAKILDLSAVLEQAQKTVDARFGTLRPDDTVVQHMKDEAVRRLAIVRAADSPDFLTAFVGSPDLSVDRYESRILDKLGSDLLLHLTRTRDGAMNWPRVRR
jgi:hypothetical protein